MNDKTISHMPQKVIDKALRLKYARRSTYLSFTCFGIIYTTLLSRLVRLRELLGNIDAAHTSLMLLCLALGNVISAPFWGALVEKQSLRLMTRVSGACMSFAVLSIGIISYLHIFPLVLFACVFMGMSAGAFNVANNMSGIAVERRQKETIMPKFHAFFGIGVVIATAFSFLSASTNLPLIIQYIVVTLTTCILIQYFASFSYKHYKEPDIETIASNIDDSSVISQKHTKSSKKDEISLQLLMIGCIVMGVSIAEGSGNDWIASGIVQAFNVPENIAICGFWAFAISMMTMRFCGSKLVDLFGRVKVLRISILTALVGLLTFIIFNQIIVVIIGCALWGFGVALGYPLGISAASEGEGNSAFRASIVASIGSVMNIACPPLIGILSNISGIRHALIIPVIGLFIAILCSGSAKTKD